MKEGILAYLAVEASKRKPAGKKSFQKLVYFLQEKGIPLDFRYTMYFYGPYSKSLAENLDELTYDGVLTYESNGLSVLVKPGRVADEVIRDEHETIEQYAEALSFVIENFATRTPSELELLSTTHYVAKHETVQTDNQLIDKVYRIKDEKFTKQQIQTAIDELRKLKMLN